MRPDRPCPDRTATGFAGCVACFDFEGEDLHARQTLCANIFPVRAHLFHGLTKVPDAADSATKYETFALSGTPEPTNRPSVAAPARRNRFARYPKTTLLVTVLVLLGLVELGCYLLIVIKGHRDLRFAYPYNRILSGYTVFQNVPGHSFRTSAIKSDPSEPR